MAKRSRYDTHGQKGQEGMRKSCSRTQTLLIIQCLLHLNQEVEEQTRALVQDEIHRLSDDFLTLASHELLTPLTAIFGVQSNPGKGETFWFTLPVVANPEE